jgi:hypothetical protein
MGREKRIKKARRFEPPLRRCACMLVWIDSLPLVVNHIQIPLFLRIGLCFMPLPTCQRPHMCEVNRPPPPYAATSTPPLDQGCRRRSQAPHPPHPTTNTHTKQGFHAHTHLGSWLGETGLNDNAGALLASGSNELNNKWIVGSIKVAVFVCVFNSLFWALGSQAHIPFRAPPPSTGPAAHGASERSRLTGPPNSIPPFVLV